jgi:predicted methyltransferase
MTRNQELTFEQDYIVLKEQPDRFVMMSWEDALMKQHAKRATQGGGDVLEIGFGMGISAQHIQDFGCNSHTIVEAHPDILVRLHDWAKDKPNVKIIEGDWFKSQDIICQASYDGIFYDADCNNSPKFRRVIVDRALKPQGIFTYFAPNGSNGYGYGDKLQQDVVEIQVPIPKNKYHNNPICSVPYFVNWI